MQKEHVELADQIKTAVVQAEGHAENAVTYSREAIIAATQAGELLDVAKGCGRETYAEILAACGQDTHKAKRWIAAAKKVRLLPPGALSEPKQLLLFFASDEPLEDKEPPTLRDDGTAWVKSFSRASEVFQRTMDHRPPQEWEPHERELFRRMAEPIVRVYQQLAS